MYQNRTSRWECTYTSGPTFMVASYGLLGAIQGVHLDPERLKELGQLVYEIVSTLLPVFCRLYLSSFMGAKMDGQQLER